MDNLIINAGGDGTRLHQYTGGKFPKLLLPYSSNRSILEEMIHRYKPRNVTVIVQERYEEAIESALSGCDIVNGFDVVVDNHQDGTWRSIDRVFGIDTDKFEDCLITWSDIVAEVPPINVETTLFLSRDRNCRYRWESNKAVEDFNGDICGLFYIRNPADYLKCYNQGSTGEDFVEALKLLDICSKYVPVEDLGDEEKYKKHHQAKSDAEFSTRYFNSIERIDENQLLKKPTCDAGKKIIKNEILAYKFFSLKGHDDKICQHHAINSSLHLEDLSKSGYRTLFDVIADADDTQTTAKLLVAAYDFINSYQNEIYDIDVRESIEYEVYDKVIDRLVDMDSVLFSINSKYLENIEETIDVVANYVIEELSEMPVTLIHGDLNAGNLMVNSQNQFKMIDLRGKYGNSFSIGPRDVDKMKLCYGLSGFNELASTSVWEYGRDVKNYLPQYLDTLSLGYSALMMISAHPFLMPDISKSSTSIRIGRRMLNECIEKINNGY